MALLGALAATALAIPVGILAARYRGGGTRWIEHRHVGGARRARHRGGLALVFLGIRFAQPIYQRTLLLVFKYAVLFLPVAVALRARRGGAAPTLAHGGGPPSAGARCRWSARSPCRSRRPGWRPVFALVMLTAMKELPATLLLRPTGMDTLATRL